MLLLSFALLSLLALAAAGSSGCAASASQKPAPAADHFDGKVFFNQQPIPNRGFWDVLRWGFTREPAEWKPVEGAQPGPRPPERAGNGRLLVSFVNHSTVLIQMDGLNILTDPIWSERASPVSWAGPRRVRPPGIRFEDLPPIDAVLISHNHYDHLDLPTLSRLAAGHKPRIFCALGNKKLLDDENIDQVVELDWWQGAGLSESLELTAVPARHFSGRGAFDRNEMLWAGFVIEGPAGAVYFAGDTGFGPHFEQIQGRFGSLRLAILPIGAFRPEWFMSPMHLSPSKAIKACVKLRASTCMAVHFGTFRLADDGRDEPVERLAAGIDSAPDPKPRFWVLGFGEGREAPPLEEEDGGHPHRP